MAVLGVCRAGAQQVCPLLAIPSRLPVRPAMFIHAHCVLDGGAPGLCCTWASCPVCSVTVHTQTHTHMLEHSQFLLQAKAGSGC
ncbi:unnamed protein product [Tetraodon nigroviridis]|uniref:(spotted green pufferfish) hypothetical protein n=1 Tax=Tetraodon nigroviridis TaxID=99883 RepID=Q4SIY3_TETNG|nr:unnamed protein product [Tetraodon nigroviridis]